MGLDRSPAGRALWQRIRARPHDVINLDAQAWPVEPERVPSRPDGDIQKIFGRPGTNFIKHFFVTDELAK
jgi:hypothetical protein